MEKIVRKILSYNPDESLRPHRDEFMSNIIALALFLLNKKGKYNFPDNCAKIILDRITEEDCDAFYDYSNRELNYDRDILMFSDDFLADLPLIAHEVCHLAQDYPKYNTVSPKEMAYYHSSEFEEINKLLKKFNNRKHLIDDEDMKNIMLYFDSFYHLQEVEFEAYCFGIEFINAIIQIGEKLKTDKSNPLTKEQEDRLFSITYESYIVPFTEKLMRFKRVRQDRKVAKQIEMLTNEFLTDFFHKHPNWKQKFLTAKKFEEEIPCIIFSCLTGILAVNYNDSLAHEYFNLLAQTNFELTPQEMLFLVEKTDIQLSPAEESIFKQFLNKYNEEYDTELTYDIVNSEKFRLKKENLRLAGKEEVME